MLFRSDQMWSQKLPLVGGLCHTADFDQMWSQKLPLVGELCHTADFDQMWSKNCPSLEDFVAQRTSTKCGPKIAPRRRTLSHSGLRPNVVPKLPLVGGLCHTADFDQMWSKKLPLVRRTLSHSGLRPNVVPKLPLVRRTLSHSGL